MRDVRAAIAQYESVVRRHPVSGYSDNALWQGANLALFAFDRFGQAADRQTAQRLLNQLIASFPASSLVGRAQALVGQRDKPVPAALSPSTPAAVPAALPRVSAALPADGVAIRDIKRTATADGIPPAPGPATR
jgi:hypothetical protein